MSCYRGKKYILITSPQLYPYARAIIENNAEIYHVNKRRNPIKLLKIISLLKKTDIDVGFNPWSLGEESEFFITFAKKYSCYREKDNYPKQYNVYERVREYLFLKPKEVGLRTPDFENGEIKEIVIAPFSSDVKKNLDRDDIIGLIKQLKDKFDDPNITVAFPEEERQKTAHMGAQEFILGKGLAKSQRFLQLLATTDLFVGVDSGPLHLADALGIKSIGIFGSNSVETFLDRDSSILPIRNKRLDGIFCFVNSCQNPVCIHELFQGDIFDHISDVDFNRNITLETEICGLLKNS
jgi:ADP-heptose:LPS heptosyltransferase